MSYDISLTDPVTKETLLLDVPHQIKGGTYAIGGTNKAELNITYNYGRWYRMEGVFPERERGGIRSIYGMTGAESITVLKQAIAVLTNSDQELTAEEQAEYERQGATGYWMPTKTNAIRPLYGLLAFAQMRPDGVWDGD